MRVPLDLFGEDRHVRVQHGVLEERLAKVPHRKAVTCRHLIKSNGDKI